MYSPDPYKKLLCDVGKRMYDKSLVVANDGNISWRIEDNRVLISPSGVCKADMTPDMILTIDMDGNVIDGVRVPSGEVEMHLRVYKTMPKRRAVVHAHPPYAAAFAVAGIQLSQVIYPTAYGLFGEIPVTKYGTATTSDLADAVEEHVRMGKKGILLGNHGALTCAADLWDAYYLMERVESYAQICLLVRQLGGGRELNADEQEKLQEKIARQISNGSIYE
jgi:Ribulose-5-phosphate 4-epimerase and related epimerases and aldolases